MEQAKRDAVNQWYANTLHSRLNNRTEDVLIIVMQRLHLDDLCGFVQEKEHWEVLNLPAIAEKDEEYILLDGRKIVRKEGEALNSQLESLDILNNLKNTIGEYNFSAQYQQRPIPAEGNVVMWEWFNFYEGKIPYVANEWGEAYEGTKLQSWDTAMTDGTNSDYSAGMTFEYYDDKYYLLDIHRGKWAFAELLEEIVLYHQRFMPRFLVIEGKGIGTSLCQQLRREYYINAEEYIPKEGKAERAVSVSPAMKLGMLYINKSIPILDEFYKEIVTFPPRGNVPLCNSVAP